MAADSAKKKFSKLKIASDSKWIHNLRFYRPGFRSSYNVTWLVINVVVVFFCHLLEITDSVVHTFDRIKLALYSLIINQSKVDKPKINNQFFFWVCLMYLFHLFTQSIYNIFSTYFYDSIRNAKQRNQSFQKNKAYCYEFIHFSSFCFFSFFFHCF